MAGITFSIKNVLLISWLTEVMGFVSRVPATLLALVFLAASLVMKGKTYFSKESFVPFGQTIATKNITFPIKFFLLQ